MEQRIFTVSQLNGRIKNLIDDDALLKNLCVRGEISNFKVYPSGHAYFSLKDQESTLSCVMFRSNAMRLRFRPENGLQVMVSGSVDVYLRDGRYQLLCTAMMPVGAGDLQLAFEQMKRRLEAEGLFAEAHKKALPIFPARIAVVTSDAGAAVHDMIRILGKRWPGAKVLVYPVHVQGAEAPAEIAAAIEKINRYVPADVIITGRGGGSAEDLMAFNTEAVARAIYASRIPVISAVGHEPDVVISDYVADRRASTPSNAAEIAVPDCVDVALRVRALAAKLSSAEEKIITRNRSRLEGIASSGVLKAPSEALNIRRMDVDLLSVRLEGAFDRIFSAKAAALKAVAAQMDAISPLKVLSRGYTMVEDKSGSVVCSAKSLQQGEGISLRFSDGQAQCLVEGVEYGEVSREKTGDL